MSSIDDGYLTTVEVKRYAYCPRIVFITHVLHLEEAKTEAMQLGVEEHDASIVAPIVSRLKATKVLRNVTLVSERLGLVGRLDFLLLTRFGEYVPVEVKWSEAEGGWVKWDHKLQLTAYALLVEESFRTTVKRCFAYYLRDRRVMEVTLNDGLKRLTVKTISSIHEMIEKEVDPGVKVPVSKCRNCGYKAYCRPSIA